MYLFKRRSDRALHVRGSQKKVYRPERLGVSAGGKGVMELGNSRVFKERRVGLPYANNLPVILITVITNLAAAFLFHFRSGVTLTGFISDAAICGMTMALCDGLYVYY